MSQNNYDAHSNQIKLDYSTRRILDVSKRGSRKAEKDEKK